MNNHQKFSDSKVDGVVDYYPAYCRDSKGQPVYVERGSTEGWIIPKFTQVYKLPLPLIDDDEVEPINVLGMKKDKVAASCFNCGENHLLNECSVPLDKHRINQNRKEFMNKFANKQSRYHIENDPRFSKFKPGIISDDLRKALNLDEHELPVHIYRMRVYGYPPGYQKSAEIECSGIAVYDSEGKEVADQLGEDGEVHEPGDKTTYDVSKLIEYPGFNVEPSTDTIDKHTEYGLPPMLATQLKSAQENFMKARSADHLKRRRTKTVEMKKNVLFDREELDMDVDALDEMKPNDESLTFVPPLPPSDNRPPPPQTPHREDSDNSSLEDHHFTSTPVSNLERERLKVSNPSLSDDSLDSSATEEKSSDALSGFISSVVSTPQGSVLTKRYLSRSISKGVNLGTPVITGHTPFIKLPDAEKFSQDITPHMDFENLPDATGKFEKLRGLLEVVRHKLQNINQDS